MTKRPKRIKNLPRIRGNLALSKAIKKTLGSKINGMRKDIEPRLKLILGSYVSDNEKLKKIDVILKKIKIKWEEVFDRVAHELSLQLVNKVSKQIDAHFIRINKDYKVKSGFQKLKLTKDIIIDENYNLIKTIPSDILKKYNTIFKNSIINFDKGSLTKQLTQLGKVSIKRAELIARDQTSKALERYHMSRAEGLGFEYYSWSTSRDERVSTGEGGHKVLEGRIYRYDRPTAIVDTLGTKGIPSQRVNCRCTALPVFLEPTDKLVLISDPKHGDYYVIK